MGQRDLRRLLVVVATVGWAVGRGAPKNPWLARMLARKPVAVMLPEPAQGRRGRMVVDPEVLGDSGDEDATLVQLASPTAARAGAGNRSLSSVANVLAGRNRTARRTIRCRRRAPPAGT